MSQVAINLTGYKGGEKERKQGYYNEEMNWKMK
jgi:hypothetical protein